MTKRTLGFFAGAAAAAGLLWGASPAWAGQAGSVTTVQAGTIRSGTVTTTTTVTGSSVTITRVDSSVVSVPSSTVDSMSVRLSLQISDDGYHGYSPSNNVATFSGTALNTAILGSGAGSTSGILSSQQTIGNANVTVQANTLLDGSTLVQLLGNSTSPSAAGGATATMVLNPAFAISNSALAARVLAVEAMQGAITAAGGSAAITAIDIVGSNTFEMSPESNYATFSGSTTNELIVGNVTGITQAQQQIGNANVQTGFNTIVFSSGNSSLPGFH